MGLRAKIPTVCFSHFSGQGPQNPVRKGVGRVVKGLLLTYYFLAHVVFLLKS